MKIAVILRHGDDIQVRGADDAEYPPRPLSDLGRLQIRASSEKIREMFGDAVFVVLTSQTLRARQSADLLAETLGAIVQESDLLSYPDHASDAIDFNAIRRLINSSVVEGTVVVVVMHNEHFFAVDRVATKDLGTTPPDTDEVRHGEGVVLDFNARTATLFQTR